MTVIDLAVEGIAERIEDGLFVIGLELTIFEVGQNYHSFWRQIRLKAYLLALTTRLIFGATLTRLLCRRRFA